MKIALIARSTLFSVKGGDTTQVLMTARELKKIGVETKVHLASEKINYTDFDLLHFFNIVRPADHLRHIQQSQKPYLVSTIYLNYSAFDRYGRPGLAKYIFTVAGKEGSEYLKNIFRFLKKQDSLVSPEYLLGHLRAIKKVMGGAAMLLPNSESEMQRFKKDTGFNGKYFVVPNGIDQEIFSQLPQNNLREEKVICVGQIYGMKNQHLLIETCNKLKLKLDIIGKAPPNHTAYFDFCKKISGPKVRFIDFIPQHELVKFYAESKVHALPSWFETTGLSSLEAGAMGCNLVVGSGGDTREYFKNQAYFCDANNPESIQLAIEKAMIQQNNNILRERILSEFTWQKAAIKTKIAYEKVLNEN
jgi:glycosyltransferase involved in cell wall biosynthesis